VAELDELNIPKATRPVAEEIIGITDEVCAKLLDAEYASLARQVVAKLARKRPMVWFIEVDGLPMDARSLPLGLQTVAFRRGYIPYIPTSRPSARKAPLPSCRSNAERISYMAAA
jgi:hypothetical protein